MPPSCAETAEPLDANSFTVKSLPELKNNDHCDLDFRLTVCDVVRRPYRGHEAASEDSMLKRGGGGMNQLLGQVEEGSPRPCGVERENSVEVWRW